MGTPVSDDLPGTRDLSGAFRKYVGKQVSYATHGIHRYPAKFIPQIPRLCIERFSDPGDKILDPFMGSGTTMLEAFVAGRDSYGIDVHPLARLIAKVKTTPLDPEALEEAGERLIEEVRNDSTDASDWIPEIPNREHWFRPRVLQELARIKRQIWKIGSGDQQDFFKICFSSIIRRVSNSDDDSLIPEVTSFQRRLEEQGKTSHDAIGRFENSVRAKLLDARSLWELSADVFREHGHVPSICLIGRDARDIELRDGSVDLAVTSPPYASAVHYVSVHKLEMFWLGLIKSTSEIDGSIIGSSKAYVRDYGSFEPTIAVGDLAAILGKLKVVDLKSAYIVNRYFEDMQANLREVNRVLKRGSRYCVVIGENTFRKVQIPTYRILAELAKESGFGLEESYVYDVINRHLDIPRWNDSRIERDHILILKKEKRSRFEQA